MARTCSPAALQVHLAELDVLLRKLAEFDRYYAPVLKEKKQTTGDLAMEVVLDRVEDQIIKSIMRAFSVTNLTARLILEAAKPGEIASMKHEVDELRRPIVEEIARVMTQMGLLCGAPSGPVRSWSLSEPVRGPMLRQGSRAR
jgi:hypothetical protein